MKQTIIVMFGGESAEHEVSVVTGLQALEQFDRERYEPIAAYVDKRGIPFLLPKLEQRKQFRTGTREAVTFGRDEKGGFLRTAGALGKKIYPYAAYLCFHGGSGESGPIEGLLESLAIAHTGPSQESAVITMNKAIAKAAAKEAGIAVVPGETVFSHAITLNSERSAKDLVSKIGLPAIVKPAHLGSSIGIAVAKSEIELEKALLEAAHMDTEMVIETFLPAITEYNCAVRHRDGKIETSEIERPLSKDEILSFADKYQRGGKKTGAGMASLSRELPAKIDPDFKKQIHDAARRAYHACRCTGMVRIDFMHSGEKLYLTEINPIPGSMAYYLWEASGIPFRQQITDAIEEAVCAQQEAISRRLDYSTDIIEKFVSDN